MEEGEPEDLHPECQGKLEKDELHMIGNLRFEAMYLPGGIPGGIQLNKMRSQTAFSRTAYLLYWWR